VTYLKCTIEPPWASCQVNERVWRGVYDEGHLPVGYRLQRPGRL